MLHKTSPATVNTAPKCQWLWLALACVLFLGQTLPLLQTRWVEDESWQSIPAYSLITEGSIRNPTFAASDSEFSVCVKPPAHTLLLAPVFKTFGIGIIQARLLSVCAGVAAVILTFWLGCVLVSPAVGVLASWLVVTDNFFFIASRTARPEIFVTVCALLAMGLAIRSTENDSLIRAIIAGLAAGIGMMFHPNGLPLSLGAFALLFWQSRRAIWKTRRVWGYIVGVLSVVIVFWLWSHSTSLHREAFVETYSRGARVPWFTKLHAEVIRYKDFLGVSNLRFSLPIPIPLRAHIALLILLSLVVLAWKNRQLLGWLSLVIIPYLLFWLYLINKTSRYFAILAPLFAIAIAATSLALSKNRWLRIMAVASCILYGLSQTAGNALFLYKNRHADFLAVQKSLRAIIPAGESVYGAITFWPALYDRNYNSYDRLGFSEAIATRHPRYLILNDRVLVNGQGLGFDDWAELRGELQNYVTLYGQLVGRVPNSFYGDLQIYRLPQPLPFVIPSSTTKHTQHEVQP